MATIVSVVGLGFVGNSAYVSFAQKINDKKLEGKYSVMGYDKYKNNGIGTLEECLASSIIFTALPTIYNDITHGYDNSPTHEVIQELYEKGYTKTIVIKSTVEPCFTDFLAEKYPTISFIHNPEFLSARTAFEDFHNQKHIVLGKSKNCKDSSYDEVVLFYKTLYESADISMCNSIESESVKLYCNTFYAVKIQYFNELYFLSEKIGADFNTVTNIMLKNGWINPMHTQVPGHDGRFSYGGLCFPKDTMALNQFMKNHNSPSKVLSACIEERNEMRPNDFDNVVKKC